MCEVLPLDPEEVGTEEGHRGKDTLVSHPEAVLADALVRMFDLEGLLSSTRGVLRKIIDIRVLLVSSWCDTVTGAQFGLVTCAI